MTKTKKKLLHNRNGKKLRIRFNLNVMNMRAEFTVTNMKISINDQVMIDGVTKLFRDHCDDYGINPAVAQRRVNIQGLTPYQAITKPVDRIASQRANSAKSPWRKFRI